MCLREAPAKRRLRAKLAAKVDVRIPAVRGSGNTLERLLYADGARPKAEFPRGND